MNTLAVFLIPLALLLPAIPIGSPRDVALVEETVHAVTVDEKPVGGFASPPALPLRLLDEARQPRVENQVRLEQRVIIRIAPSSRQRAQRSFDQLNAQARGFEEERLNDCVPINMIAAVTPHENRLLLFTRDQQILSAALERTCNPEDFYLGFYIERQDGQLCERRDRLQSRAGASCRVTRLSRLVAAGD